MFEKYINEELKKLQEVRSFVKSKKIYRKYKREMMDRIKDSFIEDFNTELILEDSINLMYSKVEGIKHWIVNMEKNTKIGGWCNV